MGVGPVLTPRLSVPPDDRAAGRVRPKSVSIKDRIADGAPTRDVEGAERRALGRPPVMHAATDEQPHPS